MAVKRKPTAHVLRISAIFLETECTVVTHENIDTMIVGFSRDVRTLMDAVIAGNK
jgi:hypothetical protein